MLIQTTSSELAMASSAFMSIFVLFALFHLTAALIPSLGLSTAQNVRSKLRNKDFVIRNVGAPQVSSRNFKAYIADATNKPALAATDTQFFVATVHVKAGRSFFKHYHPRGAEIIYVTKGRFLSKFWFEGKNPRVVRNWLKVGDSVVYPQGLVHLDRCIGWEDCTFVAVINSGDPGIVPVR